MSYLTWTIVAVLVLAAFAVFLFVPGLAVLAALALGAALVVGIVLLIARGGAAAGDTTPDVIERRNEHRAWRRRDRGDRAR